MTDESPTGRGARASQGTALCYATALRPMSHTLAAARHVETPPPDPTKKVTLTRRTMLLIEWILLVACLLVLLWRFTYPGKLYLSFFTDDFFYYAVVARNLVTHGASSFNGLQATNGYHPLWMLTIALLYRLFVTSSHDIVFFVAVVLTIWLLIVGSYRVLRQTQVFLGFTTHWYSFPFAIAAMVFTAVLSRTGMEVSLALFFLLMFWKRMSSYPLEQQTPLQAVVSGLLASCLILSRIDCIIPVAVYLAFTVLSMPRASRKVFLVVSPFLAGLLPLLVYILINWVAFHTILPVSGMAKNLRPLGLPSGAVGLRLFRLDIINVLFTWPSMAVAAVYVARLFSPAGKQFGSPLTMKGSSRRVLLCVLLHPALFYLVLSFTSDWPLWTWYLYVLVPVLGLLGPAAFSGLRWTAPVPLQVAFTGAVVLVLCIALAGLTKLNPEELDLYQSSLAVQQFAATHPGRYAMGDRAGTPAWLMSQPIVQLEGLVEDKQFLSHIKQQQPLPQVLAALGVDYYISAGAQQDGPCFSFREPYQAGPKSPTMRGRLCEEPLSESGQGTSYPTYIFKVTPETSRSWR